MLRCDQKKRHGGAGGGGRGDWNEGRETYSMPPSRNAGGWAMECNVKEVCACAHIAIARRVLPVRIGAQTLRFLLGGPQGVHTFSAFWLRSSVVSVLISLISDISSTAG